MRCTDIEVRGTTTKVRHVLYCIGVSTVRVSLTGYARHATILLYIGTDSGPISTGEDGVPIMLVW